MLVAAVGVLREQPQHDRLGVSRDGRCEPARRLRLGADVLECDGDRRLAGERHLPGEQLVEDDAERVEVGACVDPLALRLLGRQVGGGAEHRGGRGHRLVAHRARDAEVGHLHRAVVGEHDVAGLDVAVDEQVLVRVGERTAHVGGDLQAAVLGQPAGVERLLQRAPVDALHDDERLVAVDARVEDDDEVRVGEPGDVARLVLEARGERGVLAEAFAQDLDGDLAVEEPVACRVHLGHAAASDGTSELVAVGEDAVLAHPSAPSVSAAAPSSTSGIAATIRRASSRSAAGRPAS